MSVIVNGIKMPKSCDVCDFVYDLNEGDLGTHNYCGFPGIGVYVDDCIATRHKDCPLGEVKTPHRRLIEEPELFHYGGLAKISPLDFNGIAKYFFDQVKAMPTIVEAEGK